MEILPTLPITFGFAMAFVILWGAVLGFVNGYNAAIWVLIMITGVGGLTILGLLMEESGGWDSHDPRRTHTVTHQRIVHIERPRHFKRFEDDFD
ncbi:MAG: hypothetical protein ABSD49_13035 [Candidatus Bathyarchaeia archaeon]